MRGKKAKQLRKVGKVDKKTKKLYTLLNKHERSVLSHFYDFAINRRLKQNEQIKS